MEEVLKPCREPPGTNQNQAWTYHQSIARAARYNHVDVLEFLFAWPGIDKHFVHSDSFGFNVFHVVAQRGCSPKTVELLLSHSNAGINQETVQGDTPLNLYAFEHNCNVECVRLILEVGGADIRGGKEPIAPLLRAAINGNMALCRLLVAVGGADPRGALYLNAGETPRLLWGINVGNIDEGDQRRMEQELLELLCVLAQLDPFQKMPADTIR